MRTKTAMSFSNISVAFFYSCVDHVCRLKLNLTSNVAQVHNLSADIEANLIQDGSCLVYGVDSKQTITMLIGHLVAHRDKEILYS